MLGIFQFIVLLWLACWVVRYIPLWCSAPKDQKLWAACFFTMLIAGFLGWVNVAYTAAAVLVIAILGQFFWNEWKMRQGRK